jgi:hypothetical protein
MMGTPDSWVIIEIIAVPIAVCAALLERMPHGSINTFFTSGIT